MFRESFVLHFVKKSAAKLCVFVRFLYFNVYAFLLVLLCIGVLFVPYEVFLIIFRITLSVSFLYASFQVFATWNRRKRILVLLMNRNKKEINLQSFKPFMNDPCTQLIVLYVLTKKGKMGYFWKLIIDKNR